MKTNNGVGLSDLASHRSNALAGCSAYLALTSGLGREGERFSSGGAAPSAVRAMPAMAVRISAKVSLFTRHILVLRRSLISRVLYVVSSIQALARKARLFSQRRLTCAAAIITSNDFGMSAASLWMANAPGPWPSTPPSGAL